MKIPSYKELTENLAIFELLHISNLFINAVSNIDQLILIQSLTFSFKEHLLQ